jgi:predicted MFS family arabinose efflux permease
MVEGTISRWNGISSKDEVMTDSKSVSLRRNLNMMRLYYFALGGVGFLVPYLNLFYVRLGLSGKEIGALAAIGSVIVLITAPIFANMSENGRSPAKMLAVSAFLTAIGYMLLSQQRTLAGLAVMSAFMALVGGVLWPVSDALAVVVSSATQKGFGSIRIASSAGWIVTVLLGGWLIERIGMIAGFVGVSLSFVVSAVVLLGIHGGHAANAPDKQRTKHFNILMKGLLSNWAILGLGAMMAITGMASSGVMQFESVYLSKLGATEGIIGVAGIMSAVVEIPCMLWADRLLNRRSANSLLIVSMIIFMACRLLVLVAPSILAIIVQNLIFGVAYSLYTIAQIKFIADSTLPHQMRTALALLNMTWANLVSIISSPLAGAAYDNFGILPLYAVSAGGYLIGTLCLYFAYKRHVGQKSPDAEVVVL